MPTNRLYSFRYPLDIRTTLESWRQKIGDHFDIAVAHLADRDRALEDHLNLGVAQGILGLAVNTTTPTPITAAEFDITGMSVTVEVPANRVLRITGSVDFVNTSGVDPVAVVLRVWEGANPLARSNVPGGVGLSSGNDRGRATLIHYVTSPSAGAHTYRLRAFVNSGGADASATSDNQQILSIEDVGPANTF